MKKLIYTILAVSIIFISCKKDEETNPSTGNNDNTATGNDEVNAFVGVWSPTSVDVESSTKVLNADSEVLVDMDTSFTALPGDAVIDFPDKVEFTADGKFIDDGDTSSYTYSGNVLTVTHEYEAGETEVDTWEFVVTDTSLKMTMEESDEWDDQEFYDEQLDIYVMG